MQGERFVIARLSRREAAEVYEAAAVRLQRAADKAMDDRDAENSR